MRKQECMHCLIGVMISNDLSRHDGSVRYTWSGGSIECWLQGESTAWHRQCGLTYAGVDLMIKSDRIAYTVGS